MNRQKTAGIALVVVAAAMMSMIRRPAFVAAQAPPKLAVILVVDQMRADYIDRFGSDWTGGLKRLVTDGAVFSNAAYPYFLTWTCVGHATIATGTFPRTHGVVANEWPTGNPQQEPWCVDDPRAADIGYSRPVTGGHSPSQLLVPTFADQMRTSRGAHVVAVSLKADAAIMLAGHGGDAVTWISDRLDTLATSSVYATRPVPAVDAFSRANPIDAYFRRTWDRLLPPARYRDADDAIGEGPPPGWTRTFPHVLNGGRLLPDTDFRLQWYRSPFVDDYIGRLAISLVDSTQLGRHATTDVLAISFSATDLVGHVFGPRSQEIQDTIVQLDRTMGALLDHLDAALGRNQYVVALTADHGVTPIPEQAKREGRDAGRLDPSAIAAKVDARLAAAWGRGRYVAALYGTNMNLYFMPGVYDRLRASPALVDSVIQVIQQTDGVSRVLRSEQVRDAAQSTDPIVRAVALSYFPGRSGDLTIVPKPGWNPTAAPAMHGNLTPDDQRVPLVLAGAGIKPGHYSQVVTPADIAPTLAALFGITMPKAEGRVLREALK